MIIINPVKLIMSKKCFYRKVVNLVSSIISLNDILIKKKINDGTIATLKIYLIVISDVLNLHNK